MRRDNIVGFVAVVGIALIVGNGVASAQAQNPRAPDPTAGLTRQVSLTPAEQAQQGQAFLAGMESIRAVVKRQLETARTQRDVVKTLCLSDKLNQVDVAIRSARERSAALEAAANRNDTDLAAHEFTILSTLRQRVDQLSAEAGQCVGKDTETVGETAVQFTVDSLPGDDQKWTDPPSVVIIDVPTCASCFK